MKVWRGQEGEMERRIADTKGDQDWPQTSMAKEK